MNLYWRLLRVLMLSALSRPPLATLDEAHLRLRVYPNDLDTNLHMNNGRYLTLMDLGRLDLMARLGLWWPSVRRRWVAIIGASQMVYLRELRLGWQFELRTRIACWDARWFVITQRFFRGERLHAVGRVRGQIHGPEGLIAPQRYLDLAAGARVVSPTPPQDVALWLESLRAGRPQPGPGPSADTVHQAQQRPPH